MRFKLVSVLLFMLASPAGSHEFWIAPLEYVIDTDQSVKAQLRVGQNFEGAVQRFFERQIARFEVSHAGKTVKVTGRLGDDPALDMAALGEGLLVVVHETTDTVLTYRKEELFANFVAHKGVPGLIAENQKRGFPAMGFQEKFRRFAKSLIAAGDGAGQDFRVGMRAEIVALANPYTDDLTGGLPVQVFYADQIRTNAFVEVFERQVDGVVSVSTYRTDSEGIAVLQVHSGVEYLVDATLILPLPNDDMARGPVWESLWAGLTFLVPVR